VWAAQNLPGPDATLAIAAAGGSPWCSDTCTRVPSFPGRKGVATSLGVLIALDWRIALGAAATFLILVAFFRFVSLGSMAGAAFAAFFAFFIYGAHPWSVGRACRSRVHRLAASREHRKLIAGTEGRLGAKKTGNPSPARRTRGPSAAAR